MTELAHVPYDHAQVDQEHKDDWTINIVPVYVGEHVPRTPEEVEKAIVREQGRFVLSRTIDQDTLPGIDDQIKESLGLVEQKSDQGGNVIVLDTRR